MLTPRTKHEIAFNVLTYTGDMIYRTLPYARFPLTMSELHICGLTILGPRISHTFSHLPLLRRCRLLISKWESAGSLIGTGLSTNSSAAAGEQDTP